jgi:PAS domain S-box-containing protein
MSWSGGGLEETESRDHLAAIVESSDDAILSTDPDGLVVSWNAGATALYGYGREEAVGRPVTALIGGPAHDLPAIVERFRRGERLGTMRTRLRTKQGPSLPVSLTISPILDAGGLIGVSLVGRAEVVSEPGEDEDLVEGELRLHKRVLEISSQLITEGGSQALYHDLVNAAIEITDADSGTLQALDSGTGRLVLIEAVGLAPEMRKRFASVAPEGLTSCAEAVRRGGRVIVDYATDDWVVGTPEARAHLEAGVRGAQATLLVARSGHKLGVLTTHWNEVRELSDRQSDLLDLLARQVADLIESSEAGAALRASETRERLRSEQLEALLDQAPMGMYLVDADFRLRQVNPPAREVFEQIPDAIGRDLGELLRTIWGAERGGQLERIIRHTLETGEPHHDPEFAAHRVDLGVTEYYDWRVARLALPEGRPGVVCYFREISDQVNARLAIAESEERYRTLFDTMGEAFCILQVIFDDEDNCVDYRYDEVNPAFIKHTGVSDAQGRTIRELVPDIEPFWFDVYERVALTGEPVRVVDRVEAMDRWFDVEAFRIGEPEDRRVAVLFDDITERKEAEAERAALVAEIDRQRRLYDAIVSSTPDLIYVFDLDYRFTFANKALLEMWGTTLEESVGKGLRELGYEEWHAAMHEREIDEVAATGMPIRGEVGFPHARLGARSYDYIFVPVFDEEGRVESVAGTTRDVTERKRAEQALRESEERLLIAKAAANLGIHDFDVVAGTVSWDRRAREIWGVDPDEPITYALWLEGLHPEDRDRAEAAVARALDPDDDADYLSEYRVVHRVTGETQWVQVTGRPTFSNEKAVRLVGTVKDITARKETEEALKEANRRKDEFLATLSHELRNPLAAIRTGVAVLGSDTKISGRTRRMAAVIDRQSAQLVRLVDDLLDVSRISRGVVKLDRAPTDLGVLVREAVADTAGESQEADLRLVVEPTPGTVLADVDPVRIEQVVQNLLHNARKFTPPGGTVHVGVEQDEEAVIRVADSGIGMGPEDLTRVFDMFVQGAGPGNEQPQGLGIGLALARSVVDLHGGSIEARSRGPGEGSEFIVRLPLARPATDEKPETPVDGTGKRESRPGLRIVAAEDNKDALDTLELVLQMGGHELVTATDGPEALEKVRATRPDVALLDIGMPGMNGYDVARAIRAEPWGRDILLIAMTGWGREEDKRQAEDAGFDAHLTKPVEIELLDSVLASAYKPPSPQGPQRA